MTPHAAAAEAVLAALETHAQQGLPPAEAARRLAAHGPNELPEQARRSLLSVFAAQLASPLIWLLFGAAAIALAVGEQGDAAVIVGVVLLNAVIGTFQEGRAERSMEALRRLSAVRVRVVRGWREVEIDARSLVPGDLVVLAAGDAVAADARVLEAAALEAAEGALTGESVPGPKSAAPVPEETPLADRHDMVFAGTAITAGRGRALVTATGASTEVGRIARLTQAASEPPTPLERRLAGFGRTLVWAAAALFLLVLSLGALRGLPWADTLMVAVSQVVSMIPEGLPVAMTVALAVGMQRMAARGAIVRRLSAVETLGSTTVILSDKTGTLTRGEMTVTALRLAGGRTLAVSGAGYAPEGAIEDGAARPAGCEDPALAALLEAAALCNDADLAPPGAKEPRWRAVGDPTEAALVSLARKGGVDVSALRQRWSRVREVPFDPAAKAMATEHEGGRVVVKGAPEVVLELCGLRRDAGGHDAALHAAAREEARRAAEGMAARSLRVLAFAEARGAPLDPARGLEGLRGRASFLGLAGQIDPPRPEAARAVRSCREAGIRVVMVTGDHAATGLAVARELGIAGEQDVAVDGRDLAAMSDATLRERLDRISVFARVDPGQKLRIAEAFQARGHVVAMTGDGVNDAPALSRADVGVAMGIAGTEVAKSAAKIVITDDDFATIVAAVEQGRLVYRNLKKALLLLFSTSLAEIAILLAAVGLGYSLPFAAVQILWNNVVTEAVVTVNLVMEPLEGDELRRPPLPVDEPLLTRALLERVALMVPAIAVSTLAVLAWLLARGASFAEAQTAAMTTLAVCEWWNVLNCRSETRSALDLSILKNPWLVGGLLLGNVLQAAVVFLPAANRVFHTAPLSLAEVLAVGVVSSLVLWVEEVRKLLARRRCISIAEAPRQAVVTERTSGRLPCKPLASSSR